MWTPPTAQQRPEPLHRLDMHFTHAVAICIASAFASSMVHTRMTVAQGLQTGIKAVRVRLHQRTWNDGVFQNGREGCGLHLSPQRAHHRTTALHPPQHWRSRVRPCPTTTSALEEASTTLAALVLHHLRRPLMAGKHLGCVALHLV